MKPLFIPLKAKFFDQFKAGTKTTEYRLRGPRWNADTCVMGRRVILCRGYSGERLTGKVVGFHYDNLPLRNIPGWRECYGGQPGTVAACIKIELDA